MNNKYYARPHAKWIGKNEESGYLIPLIIDGKTVVSQYTLAMGDGEPIKTNLKHGPCMDWIKFKTKKAAMIFIENYKNLI